MLSNGAFQSARTEPKHWNTRVENSSSRPPVQLVRCGRGLMLQIVWGSVTVLLPAAFPCQPLSCPKLNISSSSSSRGPLSDEQRSVADRRPSRRRRISRLAEFVVAAINPPSNTWPPPNFNVWSATVYFVKIQHIWPWTVLMYNNGCWQILDNIHHVRKADNEVRQAGRMTKLTPLTKA